MQKKITCFSWQDAEAILDDALAAGKEVTMTTTPRGEPLRIVVEVHDGEEETNADS